MSYTLCDAGYRTLGPALSAEMVPLHLGRATPTLALVNVRLGGEPATAVAQLLREAGVQVLLICEGREDEALALDVLPGAPTLFEPVAKADLLLALDALSVARSAGPPA
jgi:hypothetical protein